MNAKTMIDEHDKLVVCATMDFDKGYNSLKELFEYRKRVAIELLKQPRFEDSDKEIKEIFLRIDEKIKQALGII